MINNITLIAQSAIKINNEDKIIYFDPFNIDKKYNDADYIFITHSHYDHYSPKDIDKVKKDNTKYIITKDVYNKLLKDNIEKENILVVDPNNNYNIDSITFSTIPAYNINKEFHKKEYNWVGYILNLNNEKIYVAGDTDNTDEARKINCDIALIPIGGTYTMNYEEAAKLIESINPRFAIPTHYKTIVGTVEDAYKFKDILKDKVDVEIIMK